MKNWHDLSHNFEESIPIPDWLEETQGQFKIKSWKMESTGGNQNIISFNLHCGTHVDAPAHYADGGITIDKVPFEDLMGNCLVIDVEKDELQPVELSDIFPYDKQIEKNHMIFLRTGNEDRWNTKEYEWKYPYLTVEVGEYFLKKKTKVLGLDTPGPDVSIRSGQRKGSPLHKLLLSNNVLLIENLANLKSVINRPIFVYAFPLKITGATGSPIRVLAREVP